MPTAKSATPTATPKKRYMKIKIEDNIPLPKYTKLPVRNDLEEDLKVMQPLQSRLIDLEHNEKNKNRTRTRIHAIVTKLVEQDKSFSDRRFTVGEDPKTAELNEKDPSIPILMRVWRVQ